MPTCRRTARSRLPAIGLPLVLFTLLAFAGCAGTTCYMLDTRGLEACRVVSADIAQGRGHPWTVSFDAPGGSVRNASSQLTGTTGGRPLEVPLSVVRGLTLAWPSGPADMTTSVDTRALRGDPGWIPRGKVVLIVTADGRQVDVSEVPAWIDGKPAWWSMNRRPAPGSRSRSAASRGWA